MDVKNLRCSLRLNQSLPLYVNEKKQNLSVIYTDMSKIENIVGRKRQT